MSKNQKIHILFYQGLPISKRPLTFLLLVFTCISLIGQEIEVQAENTPLNEVAYSLIEDYNIQLSYNERQLSQKSISLREAFSNADEALERILENSDFEFRKEGNVYIIIKKVLKRYLINGWVGDRFTNEALPFAHVIINGTGLITNQLGKFILECEKQENEVRISYLGYYIMDTILFTGSHNLRLTPSINGLNEITIEGVTPDRSMEIGDSPGKIRLNQKTARKLPGNGDDAVFNFLRLQPGILAAGEQSNDLIIWGSYEGHSKVMFDGFTVYGLKNFNDNISAVNPYMTKDMMVLKGAYGAEYGGRVGGIVDITGITGNKYSPAINLNINNQTMSGMASVPLNKNAALSLAFRRTYYNLYDSEDIPIPRLSNARNASTDFTIIPQYTFGDFNLKYAGKSMKLGSYYVSLYQGKDAFSYNLNQEKININVVQETSEANSQRGGAIQWGRDILDRVSTDLTVSFSDYSSDIDLIQDISRLSNRSKVFTRTRYSGNQVSELSVLNRYYLTSGKENRHQLQAGIGYDHNNIQLISRVDEEDQLNTLNNSGRIIAYVTDKYLIGQRLELKSGIRVDLPQNIDIAYIQPRVSLTYKAFENFTSYLSWGIYNQFISKTSILDDYGNYQYFWAISDNIDVPVLNSTHYVVGASYRKKNITLAAEGYYKNTEGLSRYVNLLRLDIIQNFPGNNQSFGGDFLVKTMLNKHEAWISYSLSKSLEYFSYFPENEYRYAPHDQRHEIKTAALLNFSPFYISANYVYGSGLILRNTILNNTEPERYPYRRLDLAVFYSVSLKGYKFEIGASLLNALNTENVKYANFVRVPAEQLSTVNIHTEAVPFTPAIFLNLAF